MAKTGISYSQQCNENVSQVSMTCQSTCYEFSNSEKRLVNDTQLCGASTSTREATLVKDFTDCTDWATLQSNNTNTCVLGYKNEGNCGFGQSTSQLCSYCNPSNSANGLVSPCCVASNADLSSCGFSLAAAQVSSLPTSSTATSSASRVSSTANTSASRTSTTVSGSAVAGASSSAAASSTAASAAEQSSSAVVGAGGASDNNLAANSGLSGGQIAGIVVGSVIGGLLLLGLVIFLLLLLRKRRRNRSESAHWPIEKNDGFGPQTSPASSGPSSGFAAEKSPAKYDDFGFTSGAVGLAGAGAAGAAAYGASKNDQRRASAGTAYTHRTSMTDTEGRVLVPEFQDLYSTAVITPCVFPRSGGREQLTRHGAQGIKRGSDLCVQSIAA